MNFEQWYKENESSIYNDPIGAMEQAFNAGQQQYKSLVKTVDADNLPDDNVLGFDSSGKSIIGKIWIDSFGVTICGFGGNTLSNITHYIEQKDLIKMISGV